MAAQQNERRWTVEQQNSCSPFRSWPIFPITPQSMTFLGTRLSSMISTAGSGRWMRGRMSLTANLCLSWLKTKSVLYKIHHFSAWLSIPVVFHIFSRKSAKFCSFRRDSCRIVDQTSSEFHKQYSAIFGATLDELWIKCPRNFTNNFWILRKMLSDEKLKKSALGQN